ncbi:hypothetical protein ACFWC6_33815, partial [Micromonospora chalcea]
MGHCRGERHRGRVDRLDVAQRVCPGDETGHQEVSLRQLGDASGQRGGRRRVGVRIARPFRAEQPQGRQGVVHQVGLGEVLRRVQIQQLGRITEAGDQVAPVVAAPGADDHPDAVPAALPGQRQHDVVEELPR